MPEERPVDIVDITKITISNCKVYSGNVDIRIFSSKLEFGKIFSRFCLSGWISTTLNKNYKLNCNSYDRICSCIDAQFYGDAVGHILKSPLRHIERKLHWVFSQEVGNIISQRYQRRMNKHIEIWVHCRSIWKNFVNCNHFFCISLACINNLFDWKTYFGGSDVCYEHTHSIRRKRKRFCLKRVDFWRCNNYLWHHFHCNLSVPSLQASRIPSLKILKLFQRDFLDIHKI